MYLKFEYYLNNYVDDDFRKKYDKNKHKSKDKSLETRCSYRTKVCGAWTTNTAFTENGTDRYGNAVTRECDYVYESCGGSGYYGGYRSASTFNWGGTYYGTTSNTTNTTNTTTTTLSYTMVERELMTYEISEGYRIYSGVWPSPGEWVVFKQILKSKLPDLLSDVLSLDDILNMVDGMSYGDATQFIDGFTRSLETYIPTPSTGIKAAKKARATSAGVFEILQHWRLIKNINPTFVNKMPTHWNIRISDDGLGLLYKNPNNVHDHIRISSGSPSLPWPSQHAPYVRRFKNGAYVDKYGNTRNPRTNLQWTGDEAEVHIPWNEYNDFNFKCIV